jgi:hypothetical protein
MFKHLIALALLIAGAAACGRHAERLALVPLGTWGGEDAALIVSQDGAHAHIGCTKGDVKGTIPLDADGRFAVDGSYNVDAFPVDRGILHPARFTGATDGRSLTFMVRLTDTDQTIGPATVTWGVEPHMRTCPICRRP